MSATTSDPGARFAPRQLLRRRFWPFWLGFGLAVLALTTTWTAEVSFSYLRRCRAMEYDCSYYRSHWDESSWGGLDAGEWTPLLLLLIGALLVWAAARRTHDLPSWFGRVPGLAIVTLGVLALGHVPAALGVDSWFDEPISGAVQSYDAAGGPFLMLLALWPLWVGARRIRTERAATP